MEDSGLDKKNYNSKFLLKAAVESSHNFYRILLIKKKNWNSISISSPHIPIIIAENLQQNQGYRDGTMDLKYIFILIFDSLN